MLRCFQVQGSLHEAELVEVGSEQVQVTYGPGESTGFTPLAAALAQILINDSQVQERLQGETLYGNGNLMQHQAALDLSSLPNGLSNGSPPSAAACATNSIVQGAPGKLLNSVYASAAALPVQHPSIPGAVLHAPRQADIYMPPQHDSLPPQHNNSRDVPSAAAAAARDPFEGVLRQPYPVRHVLGRQDRYAKRQPPGSFSAPRPCNKRLPVSAQQAHAGRAPGNMCAPGLLGQNQHSTEGRATAAAEPEQLDQYSAPIQAGFSHASVVGPDSGAEQPVEAALPQPSNVPAGVFHFGCKRPVQISEAALSVGRKLAEKGQWGLVRVADLATSAPTPDLQHAAGGRGIPLQNEEPAHRQSRLHAPSHAERREASETERAMHSQNSVQRGETGAADVAEPKEVMHWQNGPAREAACLARSVPAASMQGELAEPEPSEQHFTRNSSMPDQASGSPRDQAALDQFDQAPGSPDHSACPEPGAFLGSAGIAMSSWGESQLLALPSLAQHREDNQQPIAHADSPAQSPQDNVGSQQQAAPVPASPVDHATHEEAGLSSQAGPSQHQDGPTPQLEATLQCGSLKAAQSSEPGASRPETASPALHLSSAADQLEAQGASEEDLACGVREQPDQSPSATQTASAAVIAADNEAAAQEVQSRPSSAAPSFGRMPATGPVCQHAHRGVDERSLEARHDMQQNCIPATLAEEAESPEAHEAGVGLGCRLPPTLREEDGDPLQQQEAACEGRTKAADTQATARDSVVMHSQPDEASPGVPEATLPAELQDTLRELAPTVLLQSQPEADPAREESIAHAGVPEMPQRPEQIAGTLSSDPADNPFGLWSTASGKPLQVSAAALQAARARFGADTDFALGAEGHDQLDSVHEALHDSQAVHDSPEPSVPAEHSAAQHADEATATGSGPGQLPVMPGPMHQEPRDELDSRVGTAQLAPALPIHPAAGHIDAPAFAAASIWGTASGKPVHFSKERVRAAAAIFGEDFPGALSPEPPDAAAIVTLTTGSGKSLLEQDREPWQPGNAQGQSRLAAVMSIEAESHPALEASAAAAGHPSLEPAASLGVSHRNNKRSSGGTANEGAEGTPGRGDAEVEAAMPWQTASGKRLRVSSEALAAAASRLHLTSGADHGEFPIQGGATVEAGQTPHRGDGRAEAAVPWQTASGKRLRVSPEALAAAASKLHLSSGPDHGLHKEHDQSFPGTGTPEEAEETPSKGDGGAEAAVPWQTASGKRMRVSPEALAAAASRLHLVSGQDHGQCLSDEPPTLLAEPSKGSIGQAASPAQQAVQGLEAVAEETGAPDPATPLQQQPGGRAGQLSASTAGRKRSTQLPSGPGQSRARSGSTFKAPRKFMTPVSKFALQQGGRGSTPSRLQQASTAAPRQPLHDLQGTLAARLLAEAGITGKAHLSDACCHPDQSTLSMTSKSAASFKVVGEAGEQLGAADFMRMLHAAGAEPQYCSEAWVANHHRWVVWKLACYERRCPGQFAGRMLTVPVILDQLKYRYEREHGKGHRSVLQKVLEQDERPSRAMILCIAEILRQEAGAAQPGGDQVQLEVTDGWYGVRATIDGPLCHYVASGILRTGMKVRVCGAELRGGQPQAVLEASRSCALALHCNGVHRIDADAKLGWTPYQSVVVPLTAVKPGGGLLPRTIVLVQRRYPALYWDTLSDGRHIRRTPRAKAGADRIAEAQAEKAAEAAVAQVHAEERSHCRQILAEAKTGAAVKTGALMHANRILSGDSMGETVQAAAREDQDAADRYQADRDVQMAKRREELMQAGGAIHVTRSTRFLPLEVSVVLPQGTAEEGRCSMRAIIEVSNPSEDIEGIAEGSCYMVTDLTAPDTRRSSASQLLLRTTARTRWQMVPPQEAQEAYVWDHAPRRRAALVAVSPDLEGCVFDYEGIVLGVGEVQSAGAYGGVTQWLFLTDSSVGSAEGCPNPSFRPRFLALQLQAQREAMDFLSPAADVGSVASLRDLRLRALDAANNVWQAHGNENTAIQLHTLQRCSRPAAEPGSSLQRLAQWALDNQSTVQSMQAVVQQLMAA